MKEMSDPFLGTVRKTVAGSFEITIPIRTIDFEGWKAGDQLRVIAQKVEPKEE